MGCAYGLGKSVAPALTTKINEREQRIRIETPVQKKTSLFLQLWYFATDIRVLGSVRGMHAFRKYSALAVVLASALFVSYHNIEMRRTENGIFPFNENSDLDKTKPNAFRVASEYAREISSLPYVQAGNVEKLTKADELAEMLPLQGSDPSAHLRVQSLIATANAMEKDPDEGGSVELYTVKDGDTLSSIATEKNITVNTILWANTIDDEDSIMPGDEIFILPVAGLKYTIKKGETLSDIAKEYKADEDQIIAFNNLPANGIVETGTEIVIPGGEKEIPKKTVTESLLTKRTYVAVETGGGSKTVSKRHDKPNTFPYGYCTWYVAQVKYVPWRGNAGEWLYNAKAMGYKTGKTPKAGAIVVTTDNTYYGHVAIVEKFSGSTITVSEMNYKGWGVKNTRVISINDRKIRGYIY